MQQTESKFLFIENALSAFCWAACMATLSFNLLGMLPIISEFESATNNTFWQKTANFLIMFFLSIAIDFIALVFICTIPYIIGIFIARVAGISSIFYFLAGAVATAIFTSLFFISIPNLGINVQGPEPSEYEKFINVLPEIVISGLLTGATCWWRLFKYPGRSAITKALPNNPEKTGAN